MSSTVHANVLSLIGHTPLVRLDKIRAEHKLKCNLLAKLEGFSAGGSVKDRIALRMVEEAEREGRITPGVTTLVEASSGNTGIALALVAAVKGYKCIITMPEKMSQEKERTMQALGATIIRTPTEAAHDDPASNMGRAASLLKEIPNSVMLNQYTSKHNPDAHYYTTAPEIIEALAQPTEGPSSGKCDLLVAGAGTGGTISGLSRRLKEAGECTVLGVDPRGSILARPEELNELREGESDLYKVEGIGYDFIPDTLTHKAVDIWAKSDDTRSFAATRHLIATEGVLCGGSSGAALAAAVEYLTSKEGYAKFGGVEGKNVVLLFADSLRNYVTSDWLIEKREEEEEKVSSAKVNGVNGLNGH